MYEIVQKVSASKFTYCKSTLIW